MTVVELKTLPLGFRFHPTDEELIRHYLKGKITGQINSEVEVIPEIDVCKCEPWDLPDKSLIRSEDPEWFFFAPKDRKYPNGSRSNRATEAGYWKATGKDRTIKSKGEKKKQQTIGMKKTLVFHRGRAPKGERTGWIMHEYRTTEPEFESGEQGVYVLYRLFQKQVEKNERSSPDEMDKSGYSPTPSRSSPDNMEANEEAGAPLNKDSPESAPHGCPIDLPGTIETPAAPITRWLADRTDNFATNAPNISNVPVHGQVDVRAKVDPLAPLFATEEQKFNLGDFATVAAPMVHHEENAFPTEFFQGPGGFDGNIPHDPLDVFLNQTLADPDEHSSTASKNQYDSDTGIMPTEFENNWAPEGHFLGDPNWSEILSFVPDDTNPQLGSSYENAALLPYNSTDQDVLSMDSGDGSWQDLFNSMEDSSGRRDVWNNEYGYNPMHRQLQSTMPQNHSFSQQGNAQRRIRLQDSLSVANIECRESSPRDEFEDEESGIVTSKYMSGAAESSLEKDMPFDEDDAESTGITIISRQPAPCSNVPSEGDDAESTGIAIRSRRSAPSSNVPSEGDDVESTGITIKRRHPAPSSSSDGSFTQQGTAVRRLRLQSDLHTGPCSSVDGSSSCIINENKSENREAKAEIEEHVGANFAESVDISGNSRDEQKNIPAQDAAMPVPEANSVMRLRKTSEKSDRENKQEGGLDSHLITPRKGGSLARIVWLVLSVALVLLISAGIYGWV